MPAFQWTQKATNAALALADGRTQQEAADISGVNERTIRRWLTLPEFSHEVDRLALITTLARKAQRVMLAKRMIRRIGETTEKDLLDWLKYIELATEGIKIGVTPELAALAAVLRDAGRLAGSGSSGLADDEPPADGNG
jgi:hypothetical protein